MKMSVTSSSGLKNTRPYITPNCGAVAKTQKVRQLDFKNIWYLCIHSPQLQRNSFKVGCWGSFFLQFIVVVPFTFGTFVRSQSSQW